ncbi:hypothetical protein H0H93_013910 [Arthromyces matolae]|nr:hypothetical protein H0H93_013910 [Arthromyces matolae]
MYLATAAPIHTTSESPSSNAPAGRDIVPPILPHVPPNEKGKDREVLWKDEMEMPPDFIPPGTTLKIRIPSNDAGLD